MSLMLRVFHDCPEAQHPPADVTSHYDYACDECGSTWEWSPPWISITHTESSGFLGMRTRETTRLLDGYWIARERISKLVDAE